MEDGAFMDSWSPVCANYPLLIKLAGRIATVISTTASVESDFSVVKYVKNPSKSSLSNFSLQGLMAARDLAPVSKLAGSFPLQVRAS
jgi:hypothetical protein